MELNFPASIQRHPEYLEFVAVVLLETGKMAGPIGGKQTAEVSRKAQSPA